MEKEINEIYMILKNNSLINYGKYIPVEMLENYWGKYEQPPSKNGWVWYGKWCTLKLLIESDGFFLTSRKCKPGSLRIRHVNESPQVVDNRVDTNLRRNRRTSETLQKMDLSGLDERDKARLRHSVDKINMEAQAMSSVLYDL